MTSGIAYIIGAGLAGLSAAVRLTERGMRVSLHEASHLPGGRCRSYHDPQLERVIDNGNHLILSGNGSVQTYLRTIGGDGNITGPAGAEYPFVDIATGKTWTIRANDGWLPWWVLSPSARLPRTTPMDYLGVVGLLRGRPGAVSALAARRNPVWQRLLRPILLAALNTEPESASPVLIARVLRETLMKGGAACRPRIASPTLAAAFIDPAIRYVTARGGRIHYGSRLRALGFAHSRVTELAFGDGAIAMNPKDAVILALPPWSAKALLSDTPTPDIFHAILSVHFAAVAPATTSPRLIGVIGGLIEWIFVFADRISVTISHADRLLDEDREQLAAACWREAAKALSLSLALPAWQMVKERRATFAATDAENAKRPAAGTSWGNLFLAGDWTNTGLPATIEGAVRSGERAAQLALARCLV